MMRAMAGGMRPGQGPTLAERAQASGIAPAIAAKHCWVRDPSYSTKLPGIILRWERSRLGWQALVVYALPEADATRQGWLPDDVLDPA